MSEHPPIPDVTRGAGWDELLAARGEGAELTQAYGRTLEVIAKSLWREWTRGMAVVPLEDDEHVVYLGQTFTIDQLAAALVNVKVPGVAVVPLPEPDEGLSEFWSVGGAGLVLQATWMGGAAAVCMLESDGGGAAFTAATFRELCRAGLAAADRAEQLAADVEPGEDRKR